MMPMLKSFFEAPNLKFNLYKVRVDPKGWDSK